MHQTVGHPSRRTAAGLQGRAIGIPEFDACGGVIAVQQHGQLIEADAGMTIAQTPSDLRGNGVVQTPAVDDDEVITQGVHFHER